MDHIYRGIAGTDATNVVNFAKLLTCLKTLYKSLYSPTHIANDFNIMDFPEIIRNSAFDCNNLDINLPNLDQHFVDSWVETAVNPYDNVVPLRPHITNRHYKPNWYKQESSNINPGEELLFVFDVYAPFEYTYSLQPPNHFMIKTSSIVLLGSQSLNHLCDMIPCESAEQELHHEHSNNPDAPIGPLLRETVKSRMLYLGNEFFIDKSFDDYKDYSEVIKKWAAYNPNIGEFGGTHSMHEKTCIDLKARLNYPYVFQHFGSCEHVLIIKQARLITSQDCLNSSVYPFYTFKKGNLLKQRYCMVCLQNIAVWITRNSTVIPKDPTFLCEKCFKGLLYVDGKKISNFRAHRMCSQETSAVSYGTKRKLDANGSKLDDDLKNGHSRSKKTVCSRNDVQIH